MLFIECYQTLLSYKNAMTSFSSSTFDMAFPQYHLLFLSAFMLCMIASSGATLLSPGLAALTSPLSSDEVAEYTNELLSSGGFKNTHEFCSKAGILCGPEASAIKINSCTRMSKRRRLLADQHTGILMNCHQKFGANALKTLELFFVRFQDLSPGKTIIVFSAEMGSHLALKRSFLPKPISNLLPMSLDKLPGVLDTLDIAPDSDIATAMATNLQMCVDADPKGFNDRACPASMEDLTSFITTRLGTNTPKAFEFLYDPTIVEKPLTVVSMELLSPAGTKQYSCHTLSFAFEAMYCHNLPSTNIYKMTAEVTDKDGKTTTVDNLGVSCHLDTSGFDPRHPAMHALNIKPGQGEVCHLLLNAVVYAAM